MTDDNVRTMVREFGSYLCDFRAEQAVLDLGASNLNWFISSM